MLIPFNHKCFDKLYQSLDIRKLQKRRWILCGCCFDEAGRFLLQIFARVILNFLNIIINNTSGWLVWISLNIVQLNNNLYICMLTFLPWTFWCNNTTNYLTFKKTLRQSKFFGYNYFQPRTDWQTLNVLSYCTITSSDGQNPLTKEQNICKD